MANPNPNQVSRETQPKFTGKTIEVILPLKSIVCTEECECFEPKGETKFNFGFGVVYELEIGKYYLVSDGGNVMYKIFVHGIQRNTVYDFNLGYDVEEIIPMSLKHYCKAKKANVEVIKYLFGDVS